MAAGKVDDAEAIEAEADVSIDVNAVIIGSAVFGDGAHLVDDGFIHPARVVEIEKSVNSAHGCTGIRRRWFWSRSSCSEFQSPLARRRPMCEIDREPRSPRDPTECRAL